MALKKTTYPILVIIILYLYLYNPILKPGLAFGTLFILISGLYTLKNSQVITKYLKFYRAELILSILITIYVFITCTINGGEAFSMLKTLFIWILFSTIVPIFFVKAIISRYKNIVFWDVIIEVGFIASIISCVALLVPSFNDFLRSIQEELDKGMGMIGEQLKIRGFGFAYYLTSCYGFVQGLMASLCLLRLDKKHIRYVFYFITIALSVMINARTGLFPIAFTLFYFVLSSAIKFRIGQFIKYALLLMLGYYVIAQVLSLLPDVQEFIADFFEQLGSMFIEEEFEESAYSRMLVFPDTTMGLLFGEGHDIFGEDHLIHSDIGYVNQIFIGGLVFAVSLFIYELIIFVKILRRSDDKVFPTIFFLSLLLFIYKGGGLYQINAYVNLWMLFYYVLVHNQINLQSKMRLS